MKKIVVENLSVNLENIPIIKGVSLSINEGEFIGLLGANGSGKSTLLKTIYREHDKSGGNIFIDGENIDSKTNKELSLKMGVISQEFDYGFNFTVQEIVMMGRYPSKEFYEVENTEDKEIVLDSLKKVGMEKFIKRNFLTLSGGEKQRVLIARALAQQTEILIMDEPTNHLDIGHQLSILDLIKSLKKTVIIAIHDLNMALRYCDRIYLLNDGKIDSFGKPNEIIIPSKIEKLYKIKVAIEYSEALKSEHVVFLKK